MNCPACAEKRLHQIADWEMHPYAGHGFNGNAWTHPDLPQARADAVLNLALAESRGRYVAAEVKAAPVGGKA